MIVPSEIVFSLKAAVLGGLSAISAATKVNTKFPVPVPDPIASFNSAASNVIVSETAYPLPPAAAVAAVTPETPAPPAKVKLKVAPTPDPFCRGGCNSS
jgi:hypothetical protein